MTHEVSDNGVHAAGVELSDTKMLLHDDDRGVAERTSACAGCAGHSQGGGCMRSVSPAPADASTALLARRSVILRGLAAATGLFASGGVLAAAARAVVQPASAGAAASTGSGRYLGSVKGLANGQAATYVDPASGDPALLVRLTSGRFVAYDAVCTHAGCTVEFDPKRQLIVCPCHGATYDPTRNAAPIAGPTNQPLAALGLRIDAAGTAYALDASPTAARVNQLKNAPKYAGQTGDDGSGKNGGGDDDGQGVRGGSNRGGDATRPTLSHRPLSQSAGTGRPRLTVRHTPKTKRARVDD